MLPKITSRMQHLSPRKLVPVLFILGVLVSSCNAASPSTPTAAEFEPPQTMVADDLTPAPPALESTPVQTGVDDTAELFSSDQLGLCFSYPRGYTQNPYNDTVQIAPPGPIPGSDDMGQFWLEIPGTNDRTAEEAADQEVNDVPGLNPDRWTVTLGGESALVLDGMPGQNLVRRVYVVHQQTLYILTFSPTRSENEAANDQMETLYDAVTSSWAWSPCPGSG